MTKKIIIGAIVSVLVLGGTFYYIQGTPRYSLYQTKKAIQDHDSTTFNKYVDVDRIVTSLTDEGFKSVENEMNSSANSLGALGKGLVTAFLPALKVGLKESINKSIEEISDGKQNAFAEAKVKEVKQEGKSANVILLNSKNEEIRLSMIQTPERYWRVVGVNFDDFKKVNPEATDTKKIAEDEKIKKDEEKKQKEEEEKQKYEKLRSVISVQAVEKTFVPSNYQKGIYDDFIVIKFNYTNHSDKKVKGFQGKIQFLDMFGNEITSNGLKYEQEINAGETKEYLASKSYNQFMDEDKKLKDADLSNIKYEWFPSMIIYEDGTKDEVVVD
jgi:Protein of unknown function (DUF2939)